MLKAKQVIRYRKKLYGVLRSEHITGSRFVLTIQRLDSQSNYNPKFQPIRVHAQKARR